MRDETVARNYAQALFDLALRHEGLAAYQSGIETVAALLDENPKFRLFVETPRIDARDKKEVVRKAFADALPKGLLNFLLVVIDKRRQRILRDIARQFHALVDEHENRVHVEVTVAHDLDEATTAAVAERLGALLGKTAVPEVRVKPEIIGGMIVRTGDTVYDGSLRRRLGGLRRRLLATALPDDEG